MMLVLFVNKKEVSHDYRGVGYHVFFAKYTLNLSYMYIYAIFSIKKILISYIIFLKSGLTSCYLQVCLW